MANREPPKLNKAGRPIWFVFRPDSDGAATPVTREGWRVIGLGCLWIFACGTVFPVIAVMTLDWRWGVAMFVVGGAGLILVARQVIRHS